MDKKIPGAGDLVKLRSAYMGQTYAYVTAMDRTGYCGVSFFDHSIPDKIYPAASLTVIPRTPISEDALRRCIRGECPRGELFAGEMPFFFYSVDFEYELTLGDISRFLINAKKAADPSGMVKEWCGTVFRDLERIVDIPESAPESRDDFGFGIPHTGSELTGCLCSTFSGSFYAGEAGMIDIDAVSADIARFYRGLPLRPWTWSPEDQRTLLRGLDDTRIARLTPDELAVCREILDDLCAKNDPVALRTDGYSYYGGNAIRPCDWPKARDCFLRLMDIDSVDGQDKGFYANTLGYIFYYGRCSAGVPQYEDALRYFTIGAACGVYESRYKLADMYLHGYGTPVNKCAARLLICEIYDENLKRFTRGDFGCKFADAALRMGNLCRDGIIDGSAYYYYTLADFAVRLRMKSMNYYGDETVFMGIQRELSAIRELTPRRKGRTITDCIPRALNDIFTDGYSCRVTLKAIKDGLSLTAVRLPAPGGKYARKFIECLPEYGFCRLTAKIRLELTGIKRLNNIGGNEFIADEVEYYDGRYTFYHHGAIMAAIACGETRYRLPPVSAKARQSHKFASVVFSEGGRRHDYICDGLDLAPGDTVRVNASGEIKQVRVIAVYTADTGELPLDIGKYKKVLGK